MLMLSKKPWLWSLVVVLVCVAYLVSCDGKATQPKPIPEDPKDYPVYFCDTEVTPPKLFIYHPVTRQVDSIEIPWRPKKGVTVSADGKRLYLAQRNSVVVLDTDSLFLIAELLYEPDWPVAVSPDNNYVAIPGDDLHILRTTDYSLVFSDTDRTENGRFSGDSKSFYCAAGWGPGSQGVVYKVDCFDSSPTVSRRYFAYGGVFRVVPSYDEAKWFLYLNIGPYCNWAFAVYDVPRDSIVFTKNLCAGAGDIEISPDGKYAYFTNPGTLHLCYCFDTCVTVFDVEANDIERTIATPRHMENYPFLPGDMAITPDGRWLVVLNGVSPQQLYLYDLIRKRLVDYKYDENHGFYNLSVQIAE